MSRTGHLLRESLDDQRLLSMRLCDLDVQIEGSELEPMVKRLHGELDEPQYSVSPACVVVR